MKKAITIGIIAVAALAAATVFAWRYIAKYYDEQKRIAFVLDQSKSKIDGCDCLAEKFREQILAQDNAGATIYFLKLGTNERGYEPTLITSYDIPKNRRILEGRSKTERKKEEIVEDFRIKCREIERTDDTPLYQSIKRTLEFLKTKGCKPGAECEIYLQTDLAETIEPIQQIAKKDSPRKTAQSSVRTLDNNGIKIRFIGFAEIVSKKVGKSKNDFKDREHWREIWQNLFTKPELIEFSPLCPQNDNKLST